MKQCFAYVKLFECTGLKPEKVKLVAAGRNHTIVSTGKKIII